PVVSQYGAAKGLAESCGSFSNSACPHDSYCLSTEKIANQAVLCTARPAALFCLIYIPKQLDHKADTELSHRLSRITGSIADRNSLLPCRFHRNMIDAGKGYVDKLQMFRFINDRFRQGHIRKHDCICISA